MPTEKQVPTVVKEALLSDCGRYRYKLSRVWDPEKPLLAWIMLNPSTADAEQDDPTIRRCSGYAREGGYGGIAVVNLFALRATHPESLALADDPIGPDNDYHLLSTVQDVRNKTVVCAWGAHGRKEARDKAVIRLLTPHADLHVLADAAGQWAMTQNGEPRHPLYLPKNLSPSVVWQKNHGQDLVKEKPNMPQYRRKSHAIDAFPCHYNPGGDVPTSTEWPTWFQDALTRERETTGWVYLHANGFLVLWKDGDLIEIRPGDYVLRGPWGQMWTCTPDVFAINYALIEDPS